MVIARCLLSTAVMLGLCAMHVLAAASSLTSAASSAPAAAAAVVPAAGAAAPPAFGPGTVGTTHVGGGESAGAPGSRVGMPPTGGGHGRGHGVGHGGASALHQVAAGEHDHGSVSDCTLFLGAGTALLVLLVAVAAARASRPSYWMLTGWPQVLMACTPWRGPPAWHWPRIHLCVIRV